MSVQRALVFAVMLLLILTVVMVPCSALAGDVPTPPVPCARDPNCYNTDYLLGITRELTDSSDSRTLVAVLSPFTIALDVVLLPFEAFMGFLG